MRLYAADLGVRRCAVCVHQAGNADIGADACCDRPFNLNPTLRLRTFTCVTLFSTLYAHLTIVHSECKTLLIFRPAPSGVPGAAGQ